MKSRPVKAGNRLEGKTGMTFGRGSKVLRASKVFTVSEGLK